MSSVSKSELFRELPAIDDLLRRSDIAALAAQHGLALVTDACRATLADLRREIGAGRIESRTLQLALEGLTGAIESRLRHATASSLRSLINATGVILHTNLGRAPLSPSVLEFVAATASQYSNLEYDIDAGERGKRDVHVQRLFQKLLHESGAGERSPETGTQTPMPANSATSTIVVNNNAAAVLLALNTLADGGEVIVSRGELVEIGGSFRIPDVMAKSGAVLKEVGTTNRTRVSDYENAINERTRLLLRVHRSNFEISGFTEQPSIAELVELSRRRHLPLMEDLGSGALVDLASFGVSGEPNVLDSLRSGVNIVTYSGDKLLGGPQSGIISGDSALLARMRSNSLFRALRVDKLTYAALEGTLLAYVKHDYDSIPILKMMQTNREEISARAERLVAQVQFPNLKAQAVDGESVIGGGAAPSAVLPTRLVALTSDRLSASELESRLRASTPPVVSRVEDGRVLLDPRTVFPEQDVLLVAVLRAIGS